MDPTTGTPRTEAGRALLAQVVRAEGCFIRGGDGWRQCILAIEAEASAGLPPERLPNGTIDEVRFLVVSKHAARGHRTGWPNCREGACGQYLDSWRAALRPEREEAGLREAALALKAEHDAHGHREPCGICAALTASPDRPGRMARHRGYQPMRDGIDYDSSEQ